MPLESYIDNFNQRYTLDNATEHTPLEEIYNNY